ncbi:MAG TPA: AGE family epimerase/isomerase [Nocardioides sp.]|uniref:AGE family epimerase/isomerase n=1 Tax=Nocardioides sp. TaxID=35761 RepID=UPI002E2F84E1|nr:AGE family epimerase/isomerase [Nocardioides sp.]HEX5087286.1 AGE family epimerase/isomerase [Nocardioides sp.]
MAGTHIRPTTVGRRVAPLAGIAVLASMLAPPSPGAAPIADQDSGPQVAAAVVDPEVLQGDTWLRHHREDLLPYWDRPEALGEPIGNFPSFRGRDGGLLPGSTDRRLSTLARQVYGYSLAFMMTGEDRYLTYAKAGLDWINAKAKDPVYGGYYGRLDVDGNPVDPDADGDPDPTHADKELFDLASLGLAYGMYFNVTRDPAAEADLLAVRDLIFDKYYDAAQNRMKDALTYDLTTEVDTDDNGGDITDLLVPGTAVLLPNLAILTDPDRRAQFKDDLRRVTDSLIARHKNTAATNPNQRFWFWGRTIRFGSFTAQQTDFGHNLKSYAMIYNANNLFPDRPWQDLGADRTRLLQRAWDEPAARWNQRLRSFAAGNAVPDSEWWIHDEADQLLAAMDLHDGFASQDQLARSSRSFLDVFVDRDPFHPARETFARIARDPDTTDLRKSFFGKNMLHNDEHALVMYLHGRAFEGRPAKLYYAFPAASALTAAAKPYWFDAAGETRTVTRDVTTLPGHKVVEVELTGIGAAAPEPFPAPADTTPPSTLLTASPVANAAGWHDKPVTLDLTATDGLVGVKEIHVEVTARSGAARDRAVIAPGASLSVALADEGVYDVRYFGVDLLGNREPAQQVRVRIDRTAPTVSGLPTRPCVIWPPDKRMVRVADVVADDALSDIADLRVSAVADEPSDDDIVVDAGTVMVRAVRDGGGDGRTYLMTVVALDVAGNQTVAQGTCVVPHDRGPGSVD